MPPPCTILYDQMKRCYWFAYKVFNQSEFRHAIVFIKDCLLHIVNTK